MNNYSNDSLYVKGLTQSDKPHRPFTLWSILAFFSSLFCFVLIRSFTVSIHSHGSHQCFQRQQVFREKALKADCTPRDEWWTLERRGRQKAGEVVELGFNLWLQRRQIEPTDSPSLRDRWYLLWFPAQYQCVWLFCQLVKFFPLCPECCTQTHIDSRVFPLAPVGLLLATPCQAEPGRAVMIRFHSSLTAGDNHAALPWSWLVADPWRPPTLSCVFGGWTLVSVPETRLKTLFSKVKSLSVFSS